MKREFITINSTIQDYQEYVKLIRFSENYLKDRIKEVLDQENFKLVQTQKNRYHSTKLVFYDESKDLELSILIRKKNKEVFI